MDEHKSDPFDVAPEGDEAPSPAVDTAQAEAAGMIAKQVAAHPWKRDHFAVYDLGAASVGTVPGETRAEVHNAKGNHEFRVMAASIVVHEREWRVGPLGAEQWWQVGVTLAASPDHETRFPLRASALPTIVAAARERVGALCFAEYERAAEAYVRAAVEHSAARAPSTRVYCVTGHVVHDGVPCFADAGGLRSAQGMVPGVAVDLSAVEGADRFRMPPPSSSDEQRLGRARWALRALRMRPSTAALPVYLAPFAAVMGLHHGAIAIVAPMRTGKTAWASNAQRFHGPTMDSEHLPFSWRGATVAGSWALLAPLRHVSVWGDDWQRGYCSESVLETITRGCVDGALPVKALRNGEQRKVARLASLLGSTLENTSSNVSGLSRQTRVPLPARAECEPAESFNEVSAAAARGELAGALGDFVCWHLAAVGGPLSMADEGVKRHVAHFRATGHDDRAAKQLAQLARAADAVAAYMVHAGALDAAGAVALVRDTLEALDAAGKAQRDAVTEESPATIYLAAVAAMFRSGAAHAARSNGSAQPDNAREWGHLSADERTRSPCIAYLDPSKKDRVYLDPENSLAEVMKWLRGAGRTLNVTNVRELGRLLLEAGALADRDEKRGNPHRKRLSGPAVDGASFFCVHVAALRGEAPTPATTQGAHGEVRL